MRLRILVSLLGAFVVLVANACGSNGDPGVKRLYVDPGEKLVFPGDPFPGVDPEGTRSEVQIALTRGPIEDNMIILEPEDTLGLLSEWSKISVAALLEDNEKVKDFGLVPGTGFLVRLTHSEFMNFQQCRDAHRIKRRVMREKNVEIDHVIEYVVTRGETSSSIAAKFKAPLELFESLNPLARSLTLRPGQVVKVPIMKSAVGQVRDDMATSRTLRDRIPGPPAPNPTPVPVPPRPDGKTLLVGPNTEGN